MATFEVKVREIDSIEDHPNADRMEIAHIAGTDYQSCVQIGEFEEGDLVAYIPTQSLVPEDIQKDLGVHGKLAGPDANRVKTMRLRGELSQGLLYPARDDWEKGQDVQEELGIEKYVPPIPTHLDGEVYAADRRVCLPYDVESIRHWPDVLEEGEEVVITEKIHGTFCQMAVVSEEDAYDEYGRLVVASKGLAEDKTPFQPDAEENENNVYLRAAKEVVDVRETFSDWDPDTSLFILGEVYGNNIQDLTYGADAQQEGELGFRVFDIHIGPPREGRYLNDQELKDFCKEYDLERVPVLAREPYSKERVWEWAGGKEKVSGDEKHIREGVVVTPVEERRHPDLGRVQLKVVHEDYLTRNGGTERT